MSVSILRNNRQSRCTVPPHSSVANGCGGGGGGGTIVDGQKTPSETSSAATTAGTAAVGVEAVSETILNKHSGDVVHGGEDGDKQVCNVEDNFKTVPASGVAFFEKNATARRVPAHSTPFSTRSRRAKRRVYSCSDYDTPTSANDATLLPTTIPRAAKRARFTGDSSTPQSSAKRQRGRSMEELVNGNEGLTNRPLSAECLAKHKLSGPPQQPQAPNNTTQFLITDREERESCDREMGPSSSADPAQVNASGTSPSSSSSTRSARLSGDGVEPLARQRCHTAPATHNKNGAEMDGQRTSAGSMDTTTSDGDENELEEDIEDPEFAAMYDDYNFERIKSLSRDQVNREMLETQKENLHLTEKVGLLKSENQRLRALLGERGIEFAQPLNISFRKSGPNSPDNTMNFDDDVDEISSQDTAEDDTNTQVEKDSIVIPSLTE